MSNTRDFKVKNGIQPTSYFEGVGTVVSGQQGYSLSNSSYDSVSFSVASQDTAPYGLTFNSDGTKMYMVGAGNDSVYQYSLSTAFDLSTASYDSVSFSVNSEDTGPQGLVFNNDGTKMYIVGANTDSVYQYSLATSFDLSTASYDSVSLFVSSQDTSPSKMAFNSDGTKMYIVGAANDSVYQYSLSTAFDLSTASYDSVSFSVNSEDASPIDLAFSSSGDKLFILGLDNISVYQYSLSTAFDLSTVSYDSVSFSVNSEDTTPLGFSLNNDGTKMYVVGLGNKSVFQYSTALNTATLDLSTGSVFDYTPTSDVQVTLSNPADSGTVSGATLLLDGGAATGYELSNASYDSVSFDVNSQAPLPTCVKFDTTGTIMYVMCLTNDAIYQYSLSTAWDVSTASYDSKVFSVASQDSSPLGLFFKPDGTKMYLSGGVSESLYQYSLATAWDVSTASYDSKSFDITGQSIDPYELFLYSSGTKLLVLMNDALYQYSLGTAYDISTASYDSVTTSFSSQDTTMTGFEFNSSGTSLIMLGLANDKVYQYSLTTPYDITTATYDSVDFSISQDTQPHSVTFGKLGTKMFIMGLTSDTVYQYTVGTPATITYDTAIEWPSGTAPTSPAIGETDIITFNTRDGGITYSGVLAIDGAS